MATDYTAEEARKVIADRARVSANGGVMEKLDQAWDEINALGGSGNSTNLYDDGVCKTVERALDIIERLGGMDPKLRPAPQIKRCKACDGTGYFMTEEELSAPDNILFPVGGPSDECKVCDGTGYVDAAEAPSHLRGAQP